MGALAMANNSEQINHLLQSYDVVRECVSCSGFMIPSKETIRKHYKNNLLVINNVPAFKCLNCSEITYGTGTLIKAVKNAKKNFDENGNLTFEYKK